VTNSCLHQIQCKRLQLVRLLTPSMPAFRPAVFSNFLSTAYSWRMQVAKSVGAACLQLKKQQGFTLHAARTSLSQPHINGQPFCLDTTWLDDVGPLGFPAVTPRAAIRISDAWDELNRVTDEAGVHGLQAAISGASHPMTVPIRRPLRPRRGFNKPC
jgi:hypothetical protein